MKIPDVYEFEWDITLFPKDKLENFCGTQITLTLDGKPTAIFQITSYEQTLTHIKARAERVTGNANEGS